MFDDDLAIQISGDLEKCFSKNIIELEARAKRTLQRLGKFADDNTLPVNIKKTTALLIHNVVASLKQKLEFSGQAIEYVKSFKYLAVIIFTKLRWGIFTSERIKKVRKVYREMKNKLVQKYGF